MLKWGLVPVGTDNRCAALGVVPLGIMSFLSGIYLEYTIERKKTHWHLKTWWPWRESTPPHPGYSYANGKSTHWNLL